MKSKVTLLQYKPDLRTITDTHMVYLCHYLAPDYKTQSNQSQHNGKHKEHGCNLCYVLDYVKLFWTDTAL